MFSSVTGLSEMFKDKNVLITGHTGFKGSWLCLLLEQLGANVYGFSDKVIPSSLYERFLQESNFKISGGEKFADIANNLEIKAYVEQIQPHFIFHLAAESLVLPSYKKPRKTWKTNTLGSINIIETILATGLILRA